MYVLPYWTEFLSFWQIADLPAFYWSWHTITSVFIILRLWHMSISDVFYIIHHNIASMPFGALSLSIDQIITQI